MVININIFVKELFYIANLYKTKIFAIYKLLEILIINKNENIIFIIFQVMINKF